MWKNSSKGGGSSSTPQSVGAVPSAFVGAARLAQEMGYETAELGFCALWWERSIFGDDVCVVLLSFQDGASSTATSAKERKGDCALQFHPPGECR